MGHETYWTKVNAAAAAPHARTVQDPLHFEGFSYLLGTPPPAERSTLGQDPEAARRIAGVLAEALVHAADGPVWPATLRDGVAPDDNPFIPAGYTYLFQFVAHDLVMTTVPFWAAADAGVSSSNGRGRGLQLDALYGGGPAACPVAFAPRGLEDIDRALLRVGRVDPGNQPAAAGVCPFRDLARVHTPSFRDVGPQGVAAVNFDGAYQVLAADARNDASTTLAQLTALLANTHNILARALPAAGPEASYAHARTAMLQLYHRVIRNDLLPRLLHPAVRSRYERSPPTLWTSEGMPLEFSHGAARVGHAMVRTQYDMNDTVGRAQPIVGIVTANRGAGDARLPLTPDWTVQWSRFFELGGTPNYSRRIAARRSALDSSVFENHDAAADGTTLRDMLSAALARCWRLDALIAQIRQRRPDLLPADWPFALPAARQAAIAAWLRGRLGNTPAAVEAIERLSDDTPLPLFVLLEAELDPAIAGRCLGVLGSIVVAEVIYRRLAEGERRILADLPAAEAALGSLWDEVAALASMPALVRFVAGRVDFARCGGIAFI